MWKGLLTRDWAVLISALAAGFSLLFYGYVYAFGFDAAPMHAPPRYEGYFAQSNWWPFPIFFIAIAPSLYFTWVPMLQAWQDLRDSGVLRARQGVIDESKLWRLRQRLSRHRITAIVLAFLIAVFTNGWDWLPNYQVFFGSAPLHEQMQAACKFQSASFKWLLETESGQGSLLCLDRRLAPMAEASDAHIAQPAAQLIYNLVLMAQQFLIVFLAALVIIQLLLHTYLFAVFEHLSVAKDEGLYLRLNARSPLNEFGLEHWNFVLNNLYWSACPAMLGVFLSRAATSPEDYLPGQMLLGFAVPAALIGPMVATVLVRQARLPDCWRELSEAGPEVAEDYRRQQLWPLDRNWSSKLGIVLAFALAALSIGFEIHHLMGV